MPMSGWRLGLGATLVVFGFWLLSWNRVVTWLDRDASHREAEWTRGEGPWHWSLDRNADIVWPGSHGLDRSGGNPGATGVLPNGVGEFSLALRGGTIDLALVDSLVLSGTFAAPARFVVLGDSDRGATVLAERLVEAGDVPLALPLPANSDALLVGLRLRVETEAGSRIALRRFALLPPPSIVIGSCATKASAEDALEACPRGIQRLRAPADVRPESTLLWRDEVLAQRPGALIRAPDPIPTTTSIDRATRTVPPLGPALAIVLLALPLLGAASSRWGSTPSRPRIAVELALVFLPWLVLLWFGWPGDDAQKAVSLVLLVSILSALLMRGLAPDWSWWGGTRAWRAAAVLTIAALPLLAATALANALDDDRFATRALSPEKFWQYPLWVLLQQLLLIHAIAPRLRLALRSEAAGAVAAGALFGLLHLPNFSLMLATFVAGGAWAWVGYRHRALMPLVSSHIVLGLAWLWLAPPWLLRSAEIGGRYLMAP